MSCPAPRRLPTSPPTPVGDRVGAVRRLPRLLISAFGAALALLCLLAGLLAPDTAQASQARERDAIVERTWLDDPDSALSPEAALGRDWKAFTGSLSRGFTSSTTWIRLKIDPAAIDPPPSGTDRRFVLSIVPGHLDEVAVFRADRLSQPPVMVGDRHPASPVMWGMLQHAVVIEPDGAGPLELVLRLRTQSNHSIHLEALPWEDAIERTAAQRVLVIAYLVFTGMVILWASITWIEHRDLVVGLFIAHQATALLVAVMLLGVARLYGSGWMIPVFDRITSMVIPLHAIVGILFHFNLLRALSRVAARLRLLLAMALAPAVGLLLVILGQVRPGLMITQSAVAVAMPLLCGIVLTLRPGRFAGPRSGTWMHVYLFVTYLALAWLTMPQSLRVLGLIASGPWTYNGFLSYGVASTILLGNLLVIRGMEERRRRRQAAIALAQAQREADVHRARAAEQSELMTMLTHELKTPLSVVSLAMGEAGRQPVMRERALRAIDNMRNVIDRCAQVARVDDESDRHESAPALEPLAMDEALAQAVRAQLHGERVDCNVASGLPPCLADRQMLQVIIGNLLENAIKYGPAEARVRAALTSAVLGGRPGVALRVANRVGLAGRPDPGHLFQKYQRGSLARHRSGSGLGLYLSHRLAYRLGGELSLREGEGDEVCFELWLPC